MKTIILKVLILGGTSFLGPHLTHELQERGHEVTLFNRGIHNSSPLPRIEQLHGDRDGDLQALEGHHWDAVIDTSGSLPRVVEDSARILQKGTDHYTFISSISVYENFLSHNIDESYPVARLTDEKIEEITDKTYGPLKAQCEKVVQRHFPTCSLIIRPGLIVGPLDPTDRFTYWPVRILEGGDVLAPGEPEQNVQFIDVRDLAKWIVDMMERKKTGTYNATGPAESPLTFEQLLKACEKFAMKPVTLNWVSESFLNEHGVQDWVELPLWFSSQRKMPGFHSIHCQKAIRDGLTFRPLSETISAVLEWDHSRARTAHRPGLDREKEKRLLDIWNKNRPLAQPNYVPVFASYYP
jgi:2'-hydroxyisoflavone reductase